MIYIYIYKKKLTFNNLISLDWLIQDISIFKLEAFQVILLFHHYLKKLVSLSQENNLDIVFHCFPVVIVKGSYTCPPVTHRGYPSGLSCCYYWWRVWQATHHSCVNIFKKKKNYLHFVYLVFKDDMVHFFCLSCFQLHEACVWTGRALQLCGTTERHGSWRAKLK